MPGRAPVLELAEATVVRGGTRVLDRVSLTIRSGEHTAILGPNGAGKSSLIRLLTLEDYPLAPSFDHAQDGPSASRGPSDRRRAPLRWFGESRPVVADLRKRLGVVTNDLDAAFGRYTHRGRVPGLEAVASGFLGTQGLFAHQSITEAMWGGAREALQRVDAGHLASKVLTEMSAGERRRVLIARALVMTPEVLLLDEPTTGLDLVARHDFMESVRRLATGRTTILLVTHHVEEVIPEMKRVLLLAKGRIVYDGASRSVLTSERLSEVYGAPVAVSESGGYFHIRVDRA